MRVRRRRFEPRVFHVVVVGVTAELVSWSDIDF